MMPTPRLAPQQVEQLTDWIAAYIAEQHSHFHKQARAIPSALVKVMQPFFPADVLNLVRVVRDRAGEPPFYSKLRALGIDNAPPFSDMAGITFEDVVVHVEPLSAPLLFHELVHAVQYKHLGRRGFAERYVRGFLMGGSYEEIPLEKQAYALEGRFALEPSKAFSVEDDVKKRIRRNEF